MKKKITNFWSSVLGATDTCSAFLLFSLRRLVVIQVFISCRQLTRDHGGSWVDGVVLRYSWVSSAKQWKLKPWLWMIWSRGHILYIVKSKVVRCMHSFYSCFLKECFSSFFHSHFTFSKKNLESHEPLLQMKQSFDLIVHCQFFSW